MSESCCPSRLVRLVLAACVFVVILLSAGIPSAFAQNNECDVAGEAPDLIVGSISSSPTGSNYGAVDGISAFAFGTDSCNVGTCWAKWISSTNEHPVIGQSVYRLMNGRFEQIGQSWLKHGFTALANSLCGTCLNPGTGSRLGVNCSDPYSASLNGSQTRMGPKFDVNPYTGMFNYPAPDGNLTGNAIYKRLQVHNTDLDPALNPGALYFVEAQYVARDDSLAGNLHNNASYRPVAFTPAGTPLGSSYTAAVTGTTHREKPAITAWQSADASVVATDVFVPNDGRFTIAAKATDLGGGRWNYEYAIYNMNSNRAAGSVSVPVSSWAQVSNLGFHDVDYHSGEPFVGTDWTASAGPGQVSWASQTHAQNVNANALRWGTTYNFRFEVDSPPISGDLRLGLFKPGFPEDALVATIVPDPCNRNGLCEVGESCTNCGDDCAAQGGGAGCCGNLLCEAGENPCRCGSDCGVQLASELRCGDGVDDDCDNEADCADVDCCIDAACSGSDIDQDGFAACDCDDGNPDAWDTPGEALALALASGAGGETELSWAAPATYGGTAVEYAALRSLDPTDFVASSSCVAMPDPAVPFATDSATPPSDSVYFYLVRARNACPQGEGPLGSGSDGAPRAGRTCP